MVSKAVLSRIARVISVGVATLASTLASTAAVAAETATHDAHGTTHATPARVHGRAASASSAKGSSALAASEKRHGAKGAGHAEKSTAPAVTPVSDKSHDAPPKQSLTPLPTIAAALGTPIATTPASEPKEHAREPHRTPLVIPAHTARPKKARAGLTKTAATKPPCLRDATIVMRGTEEEKIALTRCDGSAAPMAVEQISVLVRPGSAVKPAVPIQVLSKAKGSDLAPGIRRVDPRLVERLQSMVDHFAKAGAPSKVFVVSGYRPTSAGSFHATGRALDLRIDGVKNEELVAYCKTLPDTGCGYYPNSSFIHVDVRDTGTGHVSWIDASGPGETPKYVAAWPPPKGDADNDADPSHLIAKLETELQLLPPPDEHQSKPDTGSKNDLALKVLDEAPPKVKEVNVEITP